LKVDINPQNKVCVLTGASGLLGRTFIRQYASQYNIVGVHYNHRLDYPDQDWKVIDPLDPHKEGNPSVYSIRSDLTSMKEIGHLVEEVLDVFGRVDVLINNAAHRHFGKLLDPDSMDDIDRSFAVNTLAPLRLSTILAKEYWYARYDENLELNRCIVNISSTAGSYVYQDAKQAVYSSTKAGLNFASYHMANEFWDIGVRVNAIAPNSFPGLVPTQRVIDEIVSLIRSKDTGRLVLVDKPPQ
jgi:NAD(P)-dependent dehydrogenase (short-subunit alcohol dehydrogenase family)